MPSTPQAPPPRTPRKRAGATEADRTVGSAIGGAILGASLGGPPGAVIGGVIGLFLAAMVNEEEKKKRRGPHAPSP